MHLFTDAYEDLIEVYPDYNLASLFTCFGIIIVLSIEQFTLWVHSSKTSDETSTFLPHAHTHFQTRHKERSNMMLNNIEKLDIEHSKHEDSHLNPPKSLIGKVQQNYGVGGVVRLRI